MNLSSDHHAHLLQEKKSHTDIDIRKWLCVVFLSFIEKFITFINL